MYAILDPITPFVDYSVPENMGNRFLDFIDLFTNPVLASLRTFNTATSTIVGAAPGWTLETINQQPPYSAVLSSNTSVTNQKVYLKMTLVDGYNAQIKFSFSPFPGGSPFCNVDSTTQYVGKMTVNGKETMHIKILPSVFGFNCPVYDLSSKTLQYVSGFMTERSRNTEFDQKSDEVAVYFVASDCSVYGIHYYDTLGKLLILEDEYIPFRMCFASNINFTRKETKEIMYPLIPLTLRAYNIGWTGGSLATYSGIYQTVTSGYTRAVQNQQPFIGEDGLPYHLWKCSTTSLSGLSGVNFGVRVE